MAKLGLSNQKLQKMVLTLYRNCEAYTFLRNQVAELIDDYNFEWLPEYEEEKQKQRDAKEAERQYYEEHPEEDFEYNDEWEPVSREINPLKRDLNKIYMVRDLEKEYGINYLTIKNRWIEFFHMIKFVRDGKKFQGLTLRYDILLWIVSNDLIEEDETRNSIYFLYK